MYNSVYSKYKNHYYQLTIYTCSGKLGAPKIVLHDVSFNVTKIMINKLYKYASMNLL